VIKIAAALFALCAAGVCAAQPPLTTPPTAPITPKHFRLTFVLTYPQGQQPSQSFVLDVPVMRDRPGMSGMSSTAGLTGQVEGSIQQNLRCTDVHESATGLAAKVTFAMDSVAMEPAPNSAEPLHHQLTFDRKIDLLLGKPTKITEEMRMMPLRKGDDMPVNLSPGPPQITVTAVQM
jgi:hypothetical protein